MIKRFIKWLKAPFYSLDDPDKLDGVLISVVALLAIVLIIFWRMLIY